MVSSYGVSCHLAKRIFIAQIPARAKRQDSSARNNLEKTTVRKVSPSKWQRLEQATSRKIDGDGLFVLLAYSCLWLFVLLILRGFTSSWRLALD
jgi:hypothetical protein